MSPPVPGLAEIILMMVWNCLTVSPWSNPLFNTMFSTVALLSETFDLASILFVEGILDVVQSTHPPSILFFKKLPDAVKNTWGIYVIVLEKDGTIPLLYIGSGTHSDDGVRGRPANYVDDYRTNRPGYVWEAQKAGYKITHKAALAWCATPEPALVPVVRLLLVAMETAFAFFFWAMYSRTMDYGIGSCCPWPRDSFEYHGLCGHSPLIEGVLASSISLLPNWKL